MKAFLYVTLVVLMLILAVCAGFDGRTLQAYVSVGCAAAMALIAIIDHAVLGSE